jgi:phosphoglycolate phosphatase-like HAD superfamily hydrolase
MVTARADRTALLKQLEDLGVRPAFHEILSEPGGNRVDLQKAALIANYLKRHDLDADGSWMIGDTEADVGAGKRAGLRTVAVLTGIRDAKHLRRAEPDYLLHDIRELAELL